MTTTMDASIDAAVAPASIDAGAAHASRIYEAYAAYLVCDSSNADAQQRMEDAVNALLLEDDDVVAQAFRCMSSAGRSCLVVLMNDVRARLMTRALASGVFTADELMQIAQTAVDMFISMSWYDLCMTAVLAQCRPFVREEDWDACAQKVLVCTQNDFTIQGALGRSSGDEGSKVCAIASCIRELFRDGLPLCCVSDVKWLFSTQCGHHLGMTDRVALLRLVFDASRDEFAQLCKDPVFEADVMYGVMYGGDMDSDGMHTFLSMVVMCAPCLDVVPSWVSAWIETEVAAGWLSTGNPEHNMVLCLLTFSPFSICSHMFADWGSIESLDSLLVALIVALARHRTDGTIDLYTAFERFVSVACSVGLSALQEHVVFLVLRKALSAQGSDLMCVQQFVLKLVEFVCRKATAFEAATCQTLTHVLSVLVSVHLYMNPGRAREVAVGVVLPACLAQCGTWPAQRWTFVCAKHLGEVLAACSWIFGDRFVALQYALQAACLLQHAMRTAVTAPVMFPIKKPCGGSLVRKSQYIHVHCYFGLTLEEDDLDLQPEDYAEEVDADLLLYAWSRSPHTFSRATRVRHGGGILSRSSNAALRTVRHRGRELRCRIQAQVYLRQRRWEGRGYRAQWCKAVYRAMCRRQALRLVKNARHDSG